MAQWKRAAQLYKELVGNGMPFGVVALTLG
jgi:hypothetical protein